MATSAIWSNTFVVYSCQPELVLSSQECLSSIKFAVHSKCMWLVQLRVICKLTKTSQCLHAPYSCHSCHCIVKDSCLLGCVKITLYCYCIFQRHYAFDSSIFQSEPWLYPSACATGTRTATGTCTAGMKGLLIGVGKGLGGAVYHPLKGLALTAEDIGTHAVNAGVVVKTKTQEQSSDAKRRVG